MTSPTQLKYLDAMGIPVWVSRDLVLDEAVLEDKDSGSTNHVDVKTANQAEDHIGSLIQRLDGGSKTKLAQVSSSQINHTNNTAAVTRTISTASTTSIDPNSTRTTNIHKQKTEIGRTLLHRVYGCGDLNADWMVIGESPDVSSNGQSQPYAGDSGTLLTNMLRAIGIEDPRRQAYLVNILKVQNNNEIEKTEKNILNQLLEEKIKQVNPKVIFVVGQISAQNLLKSDEPLARLRGKDYTLALADSRIPLVVSYYPSYLLSKPIDKRKAWEDLKRAIRLFS